ncbi:hypothetical protein L873DRAFT_1474777 [Choiromyces venosus 120613-1]|uniref:Uncharacterized protein n=1 Tax=Choiromyces venosus 120613-1 TaxID=1336337 RepID=A0A3N4JJW0_9PEZI|nr:hypothetical protein L873DRAFT_1474777 [Choiromyces venosus 120613-1]
MLYCARRFVVVSGDLDSDCITLGFDIIVPHYWAWGALALVCCVVLRVSYGRADSGAQVMYSTVLFNLIRFQDDSFTHLPIHTYSTKAGRGRGEVLVISTTSRRKMWIGA